MSGELTDSCVYNMGVMMGKLHEAAVCFVPPPDFVRPILGADSFKNEMAKLERYYTRFLSGEAWKTYQAAADKILSELAVMHRNNQNYGLIHADLHTGNMVFIDEKPHPIDFGRSGYGYFLYDMAGTLLELYPKQHGCLSKGMKV
ncbi:phosphotransferase enzyme family protein [Paenibacillus sp. GXUN7292]|uniref:phosphotransferase enzyme family protein n=1 Tax=Paenibacillus sp. GXUN7292 TaxID=3422499 RepID=UPI003D7E1C4C